MLKPNRASRPASVFRLGDEPGDDLSATTTAAERFEMVAILTRRMIELGAFQPASYSRDQMPIRIVRAE